MMYACVIKYANINSLRSKLYSNNMSMPESYLPNPRGDSNFNYIDDTTRIIIKVNELLTRKEIEKVFIESNCENYIHTIRELPKEYGNCILDIPEEYFMNDDEQFFVEYEDKDEDNINHETFYEAKDEYELFISRGEKKVRIWKRFGFSNEDIMCVYPRI